MRLFEKFFLKSPSDRQKSAKIKVLLAAHIGEPRGGVSTYYEAILNSNLKESVDLHFIETSKGLLRPDDRGKWKLTNFYYSLENILRFLFALVSVKPDIVQIGTAYGASFAKHSVMVCIARLFFIPIILQPHCSFHKLIPERPSYWRRYVLFVLGQCDGIVILSKEWESLSSLVPKTKIRYIPNAIETDSYLQLARPRDDANGKVNILYLGHIIREKGIFDLIQAAALVYKKYGATFAVNIVGEGLNKKELCSISELITSNNIQDCVRIFEPEYGEKKIDRFASTDIFVLPSYHEGMPMSIIEAMAAGLPVVSSNVGGIPELVEDEATGLLINPPDVKALSIALSELIQSYEKRQAMGARARKKAVQYFDIARNVESLISFHREIVSSRLSNVGQ